MEINKIEDSFSERIKNEINLRLKEEFKYNDVVFKLYHDEDYILNGKRTCDMKIKLLIDNKLYEVVHTQKNYLGTHKEDVYNMCLDFAYKILEIKEIKNQIKIYQIYTYKGINYDKENIKKILGEKLEEHLKNNNLYEFSKVIDDVLTVNKEDYYFNDIKTTLFGSMVVSGLLDFFKQTK